MRWDELSDEKCPIARGIAAIGDRWTILILRDCFIGISRFDQFQERLGISRTILADRLATLVTAGLLEKVVYNEKPLRFEYRLTPRGRDVYPILMAVGHFGDLHFGRASGPPYEFRHRTCGHVFTPTCACSHCGGAIKAGEVQAVANAATSEASIGSSSIRAPALRKKTATRASTVRKRTRRMKIVKPGKTAR